MCELEDELITNTVNADRPAHRGHLGVVGVTEYEMVPVESGQSFSANPAGHLVTAVSATTSIRS